MNLSELRNYKDSEEIQSFKSMLNGSEESPRKQKELMERFLDYLKSKGFTPLGSGVFGTVFTHPGIDYCVKLGKDDPSYLRFVSLCLQDKTNPHLPKFRGKPINIDSKHFAVRMELLTINFTEEEKQFMKVMYFLSLKGIAFTPILMKGEKFRQLANLHSCNAAYSYWGKNPHLIETLVTIANNKQGSILDLNEKNFMKRGDTLVITDPYAY